MPKDNRGGRASAALTRKVLNTYGEQCWLRLPGCSGKATTKDHVIPYSAGGTDDLDNLRPACRSCNSKRQNRSMAGLTGAGARVVVVIGPPAAGKTDWVRRNARLGDLVIDLDAIAVSLMPSPPEVSHSYPPAVRHVAIQLRKAAIQQCIRLREHCTVYLIHAIPTPADLDEYRANRYRIHLIDPGREVVEARCRAERPPEALRALERWEAIRGYLDPSPTAPTDPTPGAPSVELTTTGTLPPSRDW